MLIWICFLKQKVLSLQTGRRNSVVCRQSALLLLQGRAVAMAVKAGMSGIAKIRACWVILPQARDTLGHGHKPPCSFAAFLPSALGTASPLGLMPLVLLGCPSGGATHRYPVLEHIWISKPTW